MQSVKRKVTRHKKTKNLRSSLLLAFSEGIRPQKELTVTEYSDKYRVLPRGGSSEWGRWRTSRFPYLQEIMDAVSPQFRDKLIVVMKGSQVGLTETALNVMFHKVKLFPGPLLYVQKTLDAIDRFIRQRFDKAVKAMPEIRKLLNRKKKGEGNTKKLKSYPGGILIFGGANSASSLRSMPIEVLILDEEDSYDADIQEEGSPIDLAVARTRNFPRRKVFRLSSPGIKETSTIEPAFLAGDQRYYNVPCPHCGNLDYIRWENIKWENDDPSTAALLCEKCGVLIEERYKVWMFAKENGAKWIPKNPNGAYRSYHLSGLYSPLGFFSWSEAVAMWLEAEKEFSRAKLKVFINTVLGETFTEKGKMVRPGWLESRKEPYPADVPRGGLILGAGFDVQESRIEGEVIAVGAGEECWSIDYPVFIGDTALPHVWAELDEYLKKTWRHESGALMGLSITCIDSGHRAEQVYKFCLAHEAQRVFPVKGNDGWGKGFIERPLKRNKHGVFLFHAYVDEIKSKIYSQLQIENPGPGYQHFPDKALYDKKYFGMLTAEQLLPVKVSGRTKLKWDLPAGRRNEALDARCYAVAALHILGPTLSLVEQGKFFAGLNMQSLVARRKKKGRRVLSRGIS